MLAIDTIRAIECIPVAMLIIYHQKGPHQVGDVYALLQRFLWPVCIPLNPFIPNCSMRVPEDNAI